MKKLFLSILLLFTFNVFSQNEDTIKTQQLKEIEISAYKATDASPITFKNLDKNDISIKNYGQEPTQILNYTPSVTSYSDNGSYQGYTYYRLRGIDQTRINMTLNGVPMNEPENQQCYFSNYPDILQSLQNVQLQRGSGMSKNGASSYAGSLDFESYIPSNQNIIVYYGMGSYNSSRLSWQIEDLLFKYKYRWL